jgi:N-acetylmuramoyl-L-alanine amidase
LCAGIIQAQENSSYQPPDGQSGLMLAAEQRPAVQPAAAPAENLPVDRTMETLTAHLNWDPFFQTGKISSSGHQAVFRIEPGRNTSLVVYDNQTIINLESPFLNNGSLFFPPAFVAALEQLFQHSAEEDASRFQIAAIIIDPGHGGKDEGAAGEHSIDGKKTRVVEKEVTLTVSKELHRLLKKRYPAKKVLITRQGDSYPTLEERVAQANSVPLKDNEAIIYISVHANASLNKNARGFEVWYLSPSHRRQVLDKNKYAESTEIMTIFNSMLEEEFTTESIEMAKAIERSFTRDFSALMPSRGLKAEEWYVVRKARMPSVLVELGFVTNSEDAKLLANAAYLKKFATSIYNGIVDFVAKFESWNLLS